MNFKRIIVFIMMMLCFISINISPALAEGKLAVAVSQSRVLNYYGVERVAIANPEIADVLVVSSNEILLVGKAPGMTTLHIWSAGNRQSYLVEVAADDLPIANEIKNILGYNDIRVSKVGKTIILEGTVNDRYQKNRAEKVAEAYGEKVVNLLELTKPVQVKIEAQVIEIDREKLKNIGLKWGNDPYSSPGSFLFGQRQNLGSFYANIHSELRLLVRDGSAKILSQPNMITLSGEKANIMIGGEIPVPIAWDDNKITFEWKEYGIKLDIEPEVNNEGLINSRIKAEVSSLDWNSTKSIQGVGDLKIPPIKMRKAETAIALSSGQTMAIGGLIAHETAQDVTKVPFLGDLPVLGKLFQSKSFTRNETELIILITPTIVDPAEYLPQLTTEMHEFSKENPWGGANNGGKNKGVDR
ncbi:type II and III secretion system protein family protein [Dendrosporobacter sp. 1207_IL3150]|uniref:type II and III secretion system protein family protein n=1 Tax=Dendrosporobacter sp. 1207_IL3150 TaxID=3084054 RepID=UPI002FDAB8BF